MTEILTNNASIFQDMCRACLKIKDDVHLMSFEEINWYQTIVLKEPENKAFKMCICAICGHLLKKFARFARQCQAANLSLSQMLTQDSKLNCFSLQLNSSHNFTAKNLKTFYLGPENNLDISINDLKAEDDFQLIIEHNDTFTDDIDNDDGGDADDEIPLVMLSRNVRDDNEVSITTIDKIRKKKRKKSSNDLAQQNEMNTNEIKAEAEIKLEDFFMQDSCKKKTKKTIKEGFSSRMVQETDEYLVIKLSKEQVLQEMEDKSKSEKFKRALYKCEKCVKGFNFEDVLRSHMEKHSKENGEFHCDICTQYCPSAVSLRGHLKSHTTRYKCKVCGDVRLSRQHLLEHHSISHTSDATEYTCEHCYFTTNKRTVIQRHVKTHKQSERHACHECGRLFQNIESLRVHTTRHDKSKSLQCEYCTRKFIYPSLLQKHVQSVHVHKDYYCVECDVRFKSPDNLRLHFKKAKRHRDSSSYTHVCPQCDEKFVSAPSLSVHLSSAHGQPKCHACELCRRLYSSRESLKGHMRRVHVEKRAAGQPCHICKKVFSRKSVLTIHLRTHTGERPYACACGAAFAQHASLRAHRAAKQAGKHDAALCKTGDETTAYVTE